MIDALMLSVLTQLAITNFRISLTSSSLFFQKRLAQVYISNFQIGTKKGLFTFLGDVSFFIAFGIKTARTKVFALWIQ